MRTAIIFALMKKYIYADIVRQAKISQTERTLVEIVVLMTNQNHKFLARVAGEALTLGAKPLEIRQALYHVARYIGFPKVFEALDVVNEIFTARGLQLTLTDSRKDSRFRSAHTETVSPR